MKKAFKWIGIGVSALVTLIIVLFVALYVIGSSKVNRAYEVQLAALTVTTDSASIDRGAHLSRIHGCTHCHGGDLSGVVMVDAPPFRVTASNLTAGAGGIGSEYSVEDFDRAIRHGLRPNGRALVIMPSSAYHNMSDEDTGHLIAYLKNVPPVDNELPPTEIRLMGRVMSAAMFDPALEVRTTRARAGASPPEGPTAEYGEYLASITCAHCHGADLRGNLTPPTPESPPAPDLAASGAWLLGQFKETMRTGVTPAGYELDPEFMPWTMTADMKDVELEALHAYLATLRD